MKAPKTYVRDSVLLHQLLRFPAEKELLTHPKVGASWEGSAIEQVLSAEAQREVLFWVMHQGAEIDLVLWRGGALCGVECKFSDAPRVTPSLRSALADVGLTNVAIVYPSYWRFSLSDQVEVVPLSAFAGGEPLFAGS